MKGHKEAPWFVLGKNIKKNQIMVCQDDENPKLFASTLMAQKLDWVSGNSPLEKGDVEGFSCTAKIRYRQAFQACAISERGAGRVRVVFKEPQRAIAPGQSIVFYDSSKKGCLGGGEIV